MTHRLWIGQHDSSQHEHVASMDRAGRSTARGALPGISSERSAAPQPHTHAGTHAITSASTPNASSTFMGLASQLFENFCGCHLPFSSVLQAMHIDCMHA